MTKNYPFLEFLQISNIYTVITLSVFIIGLLLLRYFKKRKISFSARMLIALGLGLAVGIVFDVIGNSNLFASTPAIYEVSQGEVSSWLAILGSGFVRLLQLLAVPIVFLSIIKVFSEFKSSNFKSLGGKSLLMLLGTTAIAAIVGILVVFVFRLDHSNFAQELSAQKTERITEIASSNFPQFFLNLIPKNIVDAFSGDGAIISVVIIAVLFASAIRFLLKKNPEQVAPFIKVLDSIRITVNSVLTNVIKFMPYGVFALTANTIVTNGVVSLINMIQFIVALYAAVFIMLVVYSIILLVVGLNPLVFYKKSFSTLLFAFSSRSSVGTLPYTMTTLKNKLGVSEETADFVATLGTTIGMNGCAGVFPAMLAIIVAGAMGVPINVTFIIMVVIVVTIGSIGIAGVPGTATVAATVTLNGLGLGDAMSSIGAVFSIDPIIDMGRTMLNVAGSMVSAVVVDRWNKNMNTNIFYGEDINTNKNE